MKQLFLVQLILFLISIQAIGQDESIHPCGTESDEKVDIWLREIQQNPSAYVNFRQNDEILYLPLTIHIIGTDDGQGYFPEQSLYASMCKLNADFEEAGMFFYIEGDILYHDNTRWFEHQGWQVGNEMYQQTGVSNTINCYINDSANGNCGYAFLGGVRMYLNNSCMGPQGGTFTHEMGHTLTLPHTFSGWEGRAYERGNPAPGFVGNRAVERADSSNCQFAGDGFCDTKADYISSRWSCNNNGETNFLLIDPDSTTFRAMGANFMSYSNDLCMSEFSPEQIAAMRIHTLSQKASMVSFIDPIQNRLSSPTTTLLLPEDRDTISTNEITFSWSKVENADSYQFQLSRFGSFAIQEYNLAVTDTFITVEAPERDRRYFWRVKPNSDSDFCNNYDVPSQFTLDRIGTSVSEELSLNNSLKIHPTVMTHGQSPLLKVNMDSDAMVDIKLISLNGQVLDSQKIPLHRGNYQINLRPLNQPAGMYIYRIESDHAHVNTKIFVK